MSKIGKSVQAAVLVLCGVLLLGADAAPKVWKEGDIAGLWWSPKKESQIEVYLKDGKYFGRLAWVLPKNAEKLDVKNHDPKKRTQKLLGSDVFMGLQFDGKNTWKDGKLYDPRSGNDYDGYLQLDSQNVMSAHGFISLPIIGRIGDSKKFQRVGPNDPFPDQTPTALTLVPSVTPSGK